MNADENFLPPTGGSAPLSDEQQYESIGLVKDPNTGAIKATNKLIAMFAAASIVDYTIGMIGTVFFVTLAAWIISVSPLGSPITDVLATLGLGQPLWKYGLTLGVLNVLWDLNVRSRVVYTKLADKLASKIKV
jgi:hypothetical protein